ncbi:MAG: hypothetical protein ABIJ39_02920 [Chloroflexota bacterium]
MDSLAYLPGDEPIPGPLARFLPPVPSGTAGLFLTGRQGLSVDNPLKPGNWVLDPFGSAPRLPVEIARLGYRVLVAVNNPVTRFLLESIATPPPKSDLHAALAELGSARKGDERLESHLGALYMTECARCSQRIPAEAYIWEREGNVPVGRIYRCPCGQGGEFPATEADQNQATAMAATDGLHRSRALERIAARDDPDRVHADEALACYLPRAVYVLSTIVNRLDSLRLSPDRRRALAALLLVAFDEGSSLWAHPTERPRPKQLSVPPRFLEKNIWMALEQAVDSWESEQPAIQVANWPEVPPEHGGISLFEGPVRNLSPHLKEISLGAVVTAIPRPNHALWTLSALWSGWLWGREAAAPFKAVLHRRRYDWNWHATAMQAALKNVVANLSLNVPVFALVPECEPSFLTAVMVAGASAGLDMQGLTLRSRHDPAQILWHRRAFALEGSRAIDKSIIQEALVAHLAQRGEPVTYMHMHAAGLAGMAREHALGWYDDILPNVNSSIQDVLTGDKFTHLSASTNPETGLWGLSKWDPQAESLPDRVERSLVNLLCENPETNQRSIERLLNPEFSGLDTPSLGLIQDLLSSYALEADGCWTLRPEDVPAIRTADLQAVSQTLTGLADMIGYKCILPESPFRLHLWQDGDETSYAFYLLATARVSQLMRQNPHPPERSLLVVPGGRAGLLICKLRRDPSLQEIWDSGWRVLKYRHVRKLAATEGLTRGQWEQQLAGDPLEPPEQMRLF